MTTVLKSLETEFQTFSRIVGGLSVSETNTRCELGKLPVKAYVFELVVSFDSYFGLTLT